MGRIAILSAIQWELQMTQPEAGPFLTRFEPLFQPRDADLARLELRIARERQADRLAGLGRLVDAEDDPTERRPRAVDQGLPAARIASTTSWNCRAWPWWPIAAGSAAPPPPLTRAADAA